MSQQDPRLANLLSVAKEQYTRLVWTHKIHEKDRELLSAKDGIIKLWNVGLVGLTALSAAWSAYAPSKEISLITALLGVFSLAFLEYQRHFDKDNKMVEHRAAAKHLLSLRDRTLFLIERIISEDGGYTELRSQLETLRIEEIKVLELVPDTSPKALELAEEALKKHKDSSDLDDDADQFLPRRLRSTQL